MKAIIFFFYFILVSYEGFYLQNKHRKLFEEIIEILVEQNVVNIDQIKQKDNEKDVRWIGYCENTPLTDDTIFSINKGDDLYVVTSKTDIFFKNIMSYVLLDNFKIIGNEEFSVELELYANLLLVRKERIHIYIDRKKDEVIIKRKKLNAGQKKR